ncbi:MAG TPA: hypothetical protein VFG86_16775 [Chloroflexota bacterium]|nr:hypothetical protein [Chloroflexota bacterium]
MPPRALLAVLAFLAALLAPHTSAGAEDLQAADGRIVAALALLDRGGTTSHLRQVLDSNAIRIQFMPMSPGVYARYSVARHVVEIDEHWADADPSTLAAVIAHETTHAEDAVSGFLSSGGSASCVDSEIRAFRASALFWIDQYGSAGKAQARDDLERQLNLIADRQQRDPRGLEELVRQTYSSQCSH